MADKTEIIRNFLKQQTLAVVATVNTRGLPEAAVVEFSLGDGMDIIFDTFTAFRKYQNILQNNRVALVIGWDKGVTVQYEGQVSELKGNELKKWKDVHLDRFPTAKRFSDQDGFIFLKVQPKWIRYSDLSKEPWEIFENMYPE